MTILPERVYASLEAITDGLCPTWPVSAMCQCQRRTTVGSHLDAVARLHVAGVRQARPHTRPAAHGSAVAGELDRGNADTFAAAVRAAAEAPRIG